jgi:hypothetical protein
MVFSITVDRPPTKIVKNIFSKEEQNSDSPQFGARAGAVETLLREAGENPVRPPPL